MSQLTYLKQKIKSIETTRKITHAVRLVSMSLYAKLEGQHVGLSYFVEKVQSFFSELLIGAQDWNNPVLFPHDILDSSPLFVVIATSKGFCGSLNSNIFKFFEQSLFIEEHQSPRFITIGKKATDFIKERSIGTIICSYSELSMHNYVSLTKDLLDKILNQDKPFSSVVFFSNVMQSFFSQIPKKTKLIPLDLNGVTDQKVRNKFEKSGNNEYKSALGSDLFEDSQIWEQDRSELLNYVALLYIRSAVTNLLFQALLTEQAGRFLAMDSSTNNADKFLDRLVLQYNKQRQSLITREVSELSSGLASR